MKKVIDFIVFVLTGKGDLAKEAIEAGAISYEGQGRDRYGKWGLAPSPLARAPGNLHKKSAEKEAKFVQLDYWQTEKNVV